MHITVTKMERKRHEGDWHDKPLGWQVSGPGEEIQQFSTRADARLYASIRRTTNTAWEASNEYVRKA